MAIRITPQPVALGTTNIFVVIENITPERAGLMLDSSPGNRKCTRVDVYALSMKRGEWKIITDCIGIDEEGRLLNGHNRLKGVVKSGISVLMPVMYNVRRSDMAKIDGGKNRTAADHLALFFLKDINNCTNVSATVRLLVPYYRNCGAAISTTDMRMVTAQDIVNFVAENTEEVASLTFPKPLPGSPSAVMAACFIFNRIDRGSSETFLERLVSSHNPYCGYPIKTLEKTLAAIHGHSEQGRIDALAKTIKAWNFWRQGKLCKQIKWLDSESFPKPL